jgi:hypothetical protein
LSTGHVRRVLDAYYALGRVARPEEIAQVAIFLAAAHTEADLDRVLAAIGGALQDIQRLRTRSSRRCPGSHSGRARQFDKATFWDQD